MFTLRTPLLFIAVFFYSIIGYSQVTANFTASVTSGCSPLVVSYTNTSTGATSYNWDLGNGETPTQTNASGSYITPGTYTVTLVAHNGSASSTKTMTITVYGPPIVNFTANDTAVCPGTTVSFTNNTNPVSSGTTNYIWNFGDGGSSLQQNATHPFPTSGYYNITLVATNSNGCVSSLTKPSYIHVYTPAVVAFAADNAYFCQTPAQAVFTSTSTGSGNLSYQWEYGDGNTGNGMTATHTYNNTGTYSVTLAVTDGNGCTDSLTRPSYINIENYTGSFTTPASACVHSPVTFNNTTATTVSANWNFGDGGTLTGNMVTHTFNTAGTYNVTLIVYDGHCYDTIVHPITINPAPTGSFTVAPAHPCPAPANIQFGATGTTGSTFQWLYGDGFNGSGQSVNHTYAHNGLDTVSLIITSGAGCKDTVKQVDTIYSLIAQIIASPLGACIPDTVHFHLSAITNVPDTLNPTVYPYGINSYSWDFGDGTPLNNTASPVHIYTTAGTFTATLVFTTANGCPDTVLATIHTGTLANPSFTDTPSHICADRYVHFINTSTNATSYIWRFGDGTSSSQSNPNHQYTLPGTFNVTLVAINNGCMDSVVDSNIVLVDSPKAIIAMDYNCNPRTQVNFSDSSLGATSFEWFFSDGFNSFQPNPVHNYPSLGTNSVTLTTYNSTSGCRDTSTIIFDLIQTQYTFTADDTAICKNGIVHYTPVTTGGTAESYRWYANGIFKDTIGFHADTFNITGHYTIMSIIQDNFGCYDTAIKNNYILVAKPVDSFLTTPVSGCRPLHVEFADTSSDVTGAYLTSWQWNFGDNTTITVNTDTTSHTYGTAGTFSVTEIVTDNIGCKDTVTYPSLVHVFKPTASFYANKTTPCIGDTVTFHNIVVNTLAGSYWLFGDGDTSTQTSPIHIYSDTGQFTVSLIITDVNGCTDTATYANYIRITRPAGAFTLSDSFTICPPLLEQFTNLTTGAVSYNWIFGNGNTSAAVNPSNPYTAPGLYTVLLISKNSHGCADTVTKYINVYGYSGAFSYSPLTGCSPLEVKFSANDLVNVPTVIWDFSDGNVLSTTNGDTVSHIYTVPGAYVPKLILSNNAGCQNSSVGADTIKVDGIILGFKTGPVCEKGTVMFQDTSTSYFSAVTGWQWVFDDGTTSMVNDPTHSYDTIGTYPVTLFVTNANGCKDTLQGNVTVHALPVITATGDTTVCVGDAAMLTAYGGTNYSWAPAATISCGNCQQANASPAVPTYYTVTGTDSNGCANKDSVLVKTKNKTVASASANAAICVGDTVRISDSGAQQYTWTPVTGIDSPNSNDPVVSPTATTTYMVIAREGSCIPDTDFVTVTVHPLPTVDAGSDQTIIAGSSTVLHATGSNISTFSWAPAETLSCDSCSDPTATPAATIIYTVTASSRDNCHDSDKVTVHVFCDKSQVFIPNSFTPNGDGQNDVFYPRGTGISKIKSFRIYNRWGEVLFERTNIDINDAANAWDGTFNGSTPRGDVYVYIVDAICETGEPMTLKGDITLIR